MSSISKGPSKKEQFSTWCWNMATVLRLHSLDQSNNTKNLTHLLYMIPELEATQSIYQGFTECRPLALYLSLLISQLGHSLPQICHRGFDVMKQLLADYRHTRVIRCLELITPLFLETPESLFTCDGLVRNIIIVIQIHIYACIFISQFYFYIINSFVC